MKNTRQKIATFMSVVIAVILLQTLFYKFTAHPDSVKIFSAIGLEPYGRIGIGILELIASILLFIPKFRWHALLLTIGLMSGAVYFHLWGGLGISVNHDEGKLFSMALIVLVTALVELFVVAPDPKKWMDHLLFKSH